MKNNKDEIKLILVDDNIIFRNTLKKFLQEEFRYNIVGEASGGKEFFALQNIHAVDVILMDLQMPEMDGYIIAKKTLINWNKIPIIAITMHAEKAYLEELLSVGFKGCVFKSEIFKNIHEAIGIVLKGQYFFPPEIKI